MTKSEAVAKCATGRIVEGDEIIAVMASTDFIVGNVRLYALSEDMSYIGSIHTVADLQSQQWAGVWIGATSVPVGR